VSLLMGVYELFGAEDGCQGRMVVLGWCWMLGEGGWVAGEATAAGRTGQAAVTPYWVAAVSKSKRNGDVT